MKTGKVFGVLVIVLTAAIIVLGIQPLSAQVFINEGSNMNYSSVSDEDIEFPDWIELYNAGSDTVELLGYSLTDDFSNPSKWVFPDVELLPGQYLVVFCSGKDRKPVTGFSQVLLDIGFNPEVGWNQHTFTNPFYWDGTSDLIINICSYTAGGYTTNSVFNQSATSYNSTISAFQDNSPAICEASTGGAVAQRPNLKMNGFTIGTGIIQNSNTDYPAPYGNWYWAAKTQMLIPASELAASGLTAGNINTLAFDVVSTDPATVYDYIDISMKLVLLNAMTSTFEPTATNLHTNFKISSSGETVYFLSPTQVLQDSLFVGCNNLDNSCGSFPDSSDNIVLFDVATPAATNNLSDTFNAYLLSPTLSVASGFYSALFSLSISNPNTMPCQIRYTTDGSDPTATSTLYSSPLNISTTKIIKAGAFAADILPSQFAVASYFFGINHTTPVLSVVTDNANLYGVSGIFDNWGSDWEKCSYVEFFDSTHQCVFSQKAGLQIDGGWGGSRSNPQHSFRIELDDPVLGFAPIHYSMYKDKAARTKFSKFYLRNGSNQYLTFPQKDACQTRLMGEETNNYYSAMRPVSVYVNGDYFGVYEMREKFDEEYFEQTDGANKDSVSILSQSAWGGGSLRAVKGSVESFMEDYSAYIMLDPASPQFWGDANQYIDLDYYVDYIIGESWIGNTDWPWNNIKIIQSDKTNGSWRFCLIDMELSLNPNGWTNCYYDHINFMLGQDPGIPYINIWLHGMQNTEFRTYFINRFADVMNTTYRPERLMDVENSFYNVMLPEMPAEYARWGDPAHVSQQMSDFASNHIVFRNQLLLRTAVVRNDINANFSLGGQVNVSLDAAPTNAGRVKISTVIPDSLPWAGIYFTGNPVCITAIANQGYQFLHWNSSVTLPVPNTTESFVMDIPEDIDLTAVFQLDPNAGILTISELNYHSDSTLDAGDWIEFYNHGIDPVDISGWYITDEIAFHQFIFPAGTIVNGGSRLVLAEDTALFHAQHASVPVFGPTGFGFSNSGESLTLFDSTGLVMLNMNYLDSFPWPPDADGYGHTLELMCDTCDPALPSNWFAGCIGGSPGQAWSPCSNQILFSEINYKSAPTADAGDWVELWNTSSASIDISNWVFRDDDDNHSFVFPSGTIIPGSTRLVLFSDNAKFSSRFPSVINKTGPFTFGLGGTGDAVRLFDASGALYQSVIYDDSLPWPEGADGHGYTLELLDPLGHLCDGANWIDGCPEGSPGTQLAWPCEPGGFNEQNGSFNIVMSPNPSTGEFSIIFSGDWSNSHDVNIRIVNVFGESVFSEVRDIQLNKTAIILTGIPDGVYIVEVCSGVEVKTERIILLSNGK